MTPLKLKMAAFGPYIEPVTLDFKDGLNGEKIFLIHGATGAGKTTILDAICYALYGETSGKAREGKDMRSKGVADNISTEIEFKFALGNRIYEISREISYHPNKKDKYQTRVALLCDKNLIENKDRAVKNKITELLGFNAEQFRQVVLLPQGEFKKFLSSDSDKRQEVLNVLFDSAPYKKIEDALSERAKSSTEEVKNLKDRCEDLESQIKETGSDSLTEIQEKFSLAQEKSAELKKSFDAAQLQLSNGKILSAKFSDLQKKISELKAAQIQLAEAEKFFTTAQAEYQKRDGEESQRKELERRKDELRKIQETLAELLSKSAKLADETSIFKKAKANFGVYDGRAKKYDARLAELEKDRISLLGADVAFEKAKQMLQKANERAKLLKEISRLKNILAMEQEKLSVVEENFKTAQIKLERLQIVESAARLAEKLKDGEPCPVCGSLEPPAITKNAIPTVSELQNAEKEVKRLEKDKSQQEKSVAKITGELSSKEKQLDNYADIPVVPTAQKTFDEAQKNKNTLADCQKSIEKGNDYIRKNKNELEAADKEQKVASNAVARLEGEIQVLKKNIPEIYLNNREQLNADLYSAQKKFAELDKAWTLAQKNFQDAGNKKSARTATLKSAQKNFDALNDELKGKTPPNLADLEQKAAQASENYNKMIRETAQLETALKTLQENLSKLENVKKKLAEKEKIAETWRNLSDVANATGKGESELKISFQRYFLSTMFRDVVDEANNRLKQMSNGRYLFQQKDAGKTKAKSAGLNLEIFDENSGALRPIETLSGGESFLASLSLALGLASVVRNKVGGIKLDTIFIDEGFGSLDSETLDFAISTINELSGGRLVGIISHVEELKTQIPVRLEVKKEKNGSTAKFVR